jgi:hypothetical protein
MAPIEDNRLELTTSTKQTMDQTFEKVKVKAKANLQLVKRKANTGYARALVVVKEPQFRTISISTATGAIILAPVGGAFGTASGIVLGTAAGAVPALFTFGLSLPIGAFVGGGTGLCVGTVAGAGAGAMGGGLAGFTGYKYRVEINNGLVTIKKKASDVHSETKNRAGRALAASKAKVVVLVNGVKQKSLTTFRSTKARAGELAANQKVQVTAASATAGAVAGGGTGAIVGTTAGAALGLPLALFTFGLSIPVGGMIGCAVGTVSGGVTGATAGGVAGYGGYTYKKEIRTGAEALLAKVKTTTESAGNSVRYSAAKMGASIKCGTGGTAA